MKRLTLAMAVLVGLTGCESTTEDVPQQQTNQATVKATQNNSPALSMFEQSQSDGNKWLTVLMRSEGLKLYSTSLYDDLLDSWNKAVELNGIIASDPAKAEQRYSAFSSKTYSDAYNEHLAEVSQKYDVLMALKAKSDAELGGPIAQMDYLNQLDAASFYNEEYKALYGEYSTLFEYVTEGEDEDDVVSFDFDAEQQQFLNKAKQFEIKVVLAKYISPLQSELSLLEGAGFQQTAASTFAKAQTATNAASAVIKADSRDIAAIEEAVSIAEFETAHVRNVSAQVKKFASADSKQYEQIVLDYEQQFYAVSTALDGSDLRDLTLQEQAQSIVAAATKLRDDKNTDNLQAETAQLNEKIAELNQQVAQLSEENEVKANSQDQNQALNATLRAQKRALDKQLSDNKFQMKAMQIQLDAYKKQLQDSNQTPKSSVIEWSQN